MKRHPLSDRLREVTGRIVAAYSAGEVRAENIDLDLRLPSKEVTTTILDRLFGVFYPGFHGVQHLTQENVAFHIGALLDDIADDLSEQVYLALHFECRTGRRPLRRAARDGPRRSVERFFERLPELRRFLLLDVQAAYDGDPAAQAFGEVIFAYPGLRRRHRLPRGPRAAASWACRCCRGS